MPRIIRASKLGDAAILKELIKILAENKIRVIKSNFYNPELTLSKGNFTKIKPQKIDLINIRKGIKSLKSLSAHNHVQGLIIRNNFVIAKETSKGTKKMILSIKKSKKTKAFLIKFPKKKQDVRADLPTVGLDTLKDCKKVNIGGIMLKANQNILSFAMMFQQLVSILLCASLRTTILCNGLRCCHSQQSEDVLQH